MMTGSDNWTFSTPEEKGMDPGKLRLMDRVIYARYPNLLSCLIVRDGSIVYERYYRNIGPDDPLPVMSVNKSVLSALIGIALEKGILTNLDQLVLEFFPEVHTHDVNPQTRRLTLRHLLTMTSGFYYPRLTGDAQPIWQRTVLSRNWTEFSLKLPVRDAMGRYFNYKNTDAHLAAACLSRASGKPIGELAEKWLFQPLGMKVPYWTADDPQKLGIGTLCMTARDMAKFGQLYLQSGRWGDHRIISEEWVTASTSRHIGRYGYLWWIEEDGFSASGAGGTLIRVIPAQRIVTVFQSKHLKRFKDPREIVDRHVIPATH
jgi:CubicO group peptidase (beta-lactamase class C family)